jgi:hypothetical protein
VDHAGGYVFAKELDKIVLREVRVRRRSDDHERKPARCDRNLLGSGMVETMPRPQRQPGKTGDRQGHEAAASDLDLYDALRVRPDSHSVEERVIESVRVYRELLKHKHGRNQAAGYTEREIKQYGPREALIRTIRRGKKTDGLKLLAKHGRLDCAYEQIAIDHMHEMPEDVIERARQMLAEFANLK